MKYKKQMTENEMHIFVGKCIETFGQLGFNFVENVCTGNNAVIKFKNIGAFEIEIIPERKPLPVDTLVQYRLEKDIFSSFYTTGTQDMKREQVEVYYCGDSSITASPCCKTTELDQDRVKVISYPGEELEAMRRVALDYQKGKSEFYESHASVVSWDYLYESHLHSVRAENDAKYGYERAEQ